MLSAWEEAWKRWKLMTPLIVRPPEESRDDTSEVNRKGTGWQDKLRNTSSRHTGSTSALTITNRVEYLDEERAAEWQNYAGFLAALGGVCLITAQNEELLNSQISSSSGTVHSSGIRYVPESAVLVDKFLVEMVDLLACDNLLVREWVREILGNDLSPALYHTMFRCLEDTLTQCFSQANKNEPICEPRYTLFVEQAISVLKLVLDRLTDKSESLFMVDFSTLISLCTFYVNRLTTDAGSIKMKIKLCHLIEVLMLKKDRVTIRQEFRLRNKLLEIIAEWISDYTLAKVITKTLSKINTNSVV
jgi:neurofibromin 1